MVDFGYENIYFTPTLKLDDKNVSNLNYSVKIDQLCNSKKIDNNSTDDF